MKFVILSALASLVLTQSCKQNRVVRKEWRALSTQEQEDYFTGVLKLMKMPSVTPGSDNRFEEFAQIHADKVQEAHFVPAFLPWHRAYLRAFELEMQKVLENPNYSLPYWEWTLDFEEPEKAPVWGPDKFGGNGQGEHMCVVDGKFANFTSKIFTISPFEPRNNTKLNGCLQRDFRPRTMETAGVSIKRWNNSEEIYAVQDNSVDFPAFNSMFTFEHARVHLYIGGDMADLADPALDPIFILHHTFVDKNWAEWETLDVSRYSEYTGLNDNWPNTTVVNASLSEVMYPFDFTVKDVMNISDICYEYTNMRKVADKEVVPESKQKDSSAQRLYGATLSMLLIILVSCL
ncbi:hypothetical protein HDU92_005776 [Lobulomyces angularis]|nr:hypothetical protein HDU92_005776 [Lobulomyces angularis]